MVVYAFYSDSACTNVIGCGSETTNVLTNIDVKVTVPSGANYIGLSKLKTGNTLALFSYTELSVDKIAALQTQITSLSNQLNTVINSVYEDTNTVVSTSEIRTGYYLDSGGNLSGGGTFPNYAIDLYTVTPGNKYKLLGTSGGIIAVAAYFTDATLGTLVGVVSPQAENTNFNVDL